MGILEFLGLLRPHQQLPIYCSIILFDLQSVTGGSSNGGDIYYLYNI